MIQPDPHHCAGQVGCRSGGIQDRWDAGQLGCRTGGMQERWDAGQVRYRTGGMQDWTDAGKERLMRGMQDRSRVVEPEPPFLAGASARKKDCSSSDLW